MIVECPQCKSAGTFGWLGELKQERIVALITHIKGKKTIHNPFTDRDEVVDDIERHFLTLDQLKDLEWFQKWKVEKERLEKEAQERMDREWEKAGIEELRWG